MAPDEHQDTYTYRGRTLEELVPRIRQELGDDAVIVSRRETTVSVSISGSSPRAIG